MAVPDSVAGERAYEVVLASRTLAAGTELFLKLWSFAI